MNTLVLPLPGRKARRSGLFGWVANVFAGVRDGLRLARHYQELSALSDAELARKGLARKDIVRAAMAALD